MAELIIGIDPDVEKSGVAIWCDGWVGIEVLSFFDLYDRLPQYKKDYDLKVIIEASWLNKKVNYHGGKGGAGQKPAHSVGTGQKIAHSVGRNHVIGQLLDQMCKKLGIETILVRPTRKKLDQHQFNEVTGHKGRTNPEKRDAAMLVWRYIHPEVRV